MVGRVIATQFIISLSILAKLAGTHISSVNKWQSKYERARGCRANAQEKKSLFLLSKSINIFSTHHNYLRPLFY
jgi:hypothetical protein